LSEHVDGYIWRILISPRLTVSLRDLEEVWTFEDLVNAHEMLDALDEAEALQAKK
jgi:hypothetical protein